MTTTTTKNELMDKLLGSTLLEAKQGDTPGDFAKAAADVENILAEAYQKAHRLKAMFDQMEEVPNSLKGIYDANAKLALEIGAAKQKAYNTRMQLSKAMR